LVVAAEIARIEQAVAVAVASLGLALHLTRGRELQGGKAHLPKMQRHVREEVRQPSRINLFSSYPLICRNPIADLTGEQKNV
jgi:hypothetical protein